MTSTVLSRAAGHGRPAAPVRIVHLGLGAFFRAHQAWYTDRAPDAAQWGIAAFGGRGARAADALAAQDGLYTLITRGADRDRFAVVSSISRAHAAADEAAWLARLASPEVAVVTLTVTEAGYRDTAVLGRLLAGLAARRRADAGPIALVPCDNLPANGAVLAQALGDLAARSDPALAEWLAGAVSTVTTVVDRITPRTTPQDVATVASATGLADRAPVVTEPFSEWVLGGAFPAGRPRWEDAGAVFAQDVAPYEQRKLWLLNGAHSLLAYAGLARGLATVDEAVDDDVCRAWLGRWWAEAAPHVALPGAAIAAYCDALLARLANPRISHALAQIAADGSQKLPVRVVPVLRAERVAGRMPAGAVLVLAAWVRHLRGAGAAVDDVRAGDLAGLSAGRLADAVPRLLAVLGPELADDTALVAAVRGQAAGLGAVGD